MWLCWWKSNQSGGGCQVIKKLPDQYLAHMADTLVHLSAAQRIPKHCKQTPRHPGPFATLSRDPAHKETASVEFVASRNMINTKMERSRLSSGRNEDLTRFRQGS